MSDRGSGRTSSQLAALPDGAWYLVPNPAHRAHCERLLAAAGRARSALIFVTAGLSERMIWGLRPPIWDVDHAYFDVARRYRAQRAYDLMWMAAGRGPGGTTIQT